MGEGTSGQVVVELKLSGKIELPSVTTEMASPEVSRRAGRIVSLFAQPRERTAVRRTQFRRRRSAASSARATQSELCRRASFAGILLIPRRPFKATLSACAEEPSNTA